MVYLSAKYKNIHINLPHPLTSCGAFRLSIHCMCVFLVFCQLPKVRSNSHNSDLKFYSLNLTDATLANWNVSKDLQNSEQTPQRPCLLPISSYI